MCWQERSVYKRWRIFTMFMMGLDEISWNCWNKNFLIFL